MRDNIFVVAFFPEIQPFVIIFDMLLSVSVEFIFTYFTSIIPCWDSERLFMI